MTNFNFVTLAVVVVICLGFAAAGSIPVSESLKTWFPSLAKPPFQIPMTAFVLAGALGYVMDGLILYRLIEFVQSPAGKVITITGMLVVMAYNELWNIAFFRLRNTLVGFVGVVAFLAPLIILQVALFEYEVVSAVMLAVYVVWVMVYDVPWAYALWKRNPPAATVVADP